MDRLWPQVSFTINRGGNVRDRLQCGVCRAKGLTLCECPARREAEGPEAQILSDACTNDHCVRHQRPLNSLA